MEYFQFKDYVQIQIIYLALVSDSKSQKAMTTINFTIVATDMVWQWYHDELGNKHVREIIGREATKFIEELRPSIQKKTAILSPPEIEEENNVQRENGARSNDIIETNH